MPYIVKIQSGSGKNKARTQSVPLPNKARVRAYISRNPLGNYNTDVKITNTRTKKTSTIKKGTASIWGRNLAREIRRSK